MVIFQKVNIFTDEMELIPPKKVIVKKSEGRGLGCFANEKIYKDEIIEETYCLLIQEDNLFHKYRFRYIKKNPISINFIRPFESVLPLGYGSIYNHNNLPNANWRPSNKSEDGIRIFEFYALKDIEMGMEIFTYYGGEKYWKNKNVKLI